VALHAAHGDCHVVSDDLQSKCIEQCMEYGRKMDEKYECFPWDAEIMKMKFLT
jgi:hypothetical protein